jgi:hypothetical protein
MVDYKSETQAKILARALYEVRVLLSGYLGSQTAADINVRQAAHLAYALHNEALAVVEDRPFDPIAAVRQLTAVDAMLGSEFTAIFGALLEPGVD